LRPGQNKTRHDNLSQGRAEKEGDMGPALFRRKVKGTGKKGGEATLGGMVSRKLDWNLDTLGRMVGGGQEKRVPS